MGAPAQGGQQVTPNQGGMFATGPSIVMPNGMSSGDVQIAGVGGLQQAPAPSSGQNLAALMGGGGGPMPAPMADPLASFANSGATLPLSPNADPRGIPMPTAGMRGGPAPAGSGKGGGGAVGQPMPRPTQGQFAPLAPQGGFNVNQAAAGALQQAMQGTQGAMQGPLAVGQFMNPYTQNVINRTQMDIMRQQQMAQNQLGAQATAARAFGGSRIAVFSTAHYSRCAQRLEQQRRTPTNDEASELRSALAYAAAPLIVFNSFFSSTT